MTLLTLIFFHWLFFIFHLVSFYLSPSYRYLCFIFHSLFFKYFIFNLIAFLNFELAILILIFFILRRFNFYLFIFHLVSFTVYLLLISFNFSDYFDLFTCLYAPSIFSLFLLHIIRFVLMSFFHLLPFYPFIFSCLLSFFTGYLHNIFYLSLILFLPFYILFSFIFHLFIFMHYSVTFNIWSCCSLSVLPFILLLFRFNIKLNFIFQLIDFCIFFGRLMFSDSFIFNLFVKYPSSFFLFLSSFFF